MYIPDHFKMPDEESMHDFIDRYDFGVLVSSSLSATHMPFLLQRDEGDHGVLHGHVARANPQWQEIKHDQALVIFSGPHALISPVWYESKPAVPTWNYSTVHASGKITLLSDSETAETINAMLGRYEPALLEGSEILTGDYKSRLLKAIVGFRLEIKLLEGKAKLSQNRSRADRQGVISHLLASADTSSVALAEMMQESLDSDG